VLKFIKDPWLSPQQSKLSDCPSSDTLHDRMTA